MITPRFIRYLKELTIGINEGKIPNPMHFKDIVAISSSVMAYKLIYYLTEKGIMTKTEKGYEVDVKKLNEELIYLLDLYKKGKI
jgi:hypothetical protein